MSKNTIKILSAVFAGIMLAAAMTSCGEVEKPQDLNNPPAVVSDSPAAAEPTVDSAQVSTSPEINITPEAETSPVTSQTDESTEPEQSTEPVTEPSAEPTTEPEPIAEPITEPEAPAVDREKIVDIATSQLGVPFCQGGDSPDEGFDSTGFTYYCVNEAGTEFPRRLSDQLESGELIPYSEMKPGDIAYFAAEEGGKASFCGVYAGGGLIIYSPVPDDFVKTANITTNYWTTRFVTGLRVANPQ